MDLWLKTADWKKLRRSKSESDEDVTENAETEKTMVRKVDMHIYEGRTIFERDYPFWVSLLRYIGSLTLSLKTLCSRCTKKWPF